MTLPTNPVQKLLAQFAVEVHAHDCAVEDGSRLVSLDQDLAAGRLGLADRGGAGSKCEAGEPAGAQVQLVGALARVLAGAGGGEQVAAGVAGSVRQLAVRRRALHRSGEQRVPAAERIDQVQDHRAGLRLAGVDRAVEVLCEGPSQADLRPRDQRVGRYLTCSGPRGGRAVASALAAMAVLWAQLAPRLIRTHPAAAAMAVLRRGRRRGGSRSSIVNTLKHQITGLHKIRRTLRLLGDGCRRRPGRSGRSLPGELTHIIGS